MAKHYRRRLPPSFYVHRGVVWKLAETRGITENTLPVGSRVCVVSAAKHSTAYTTSVENAMGIQVPGVRK